MRLIGTRFIDAYESSSSPEFAAMAKSAKKMVRTNNGMTNGSNGSFVLDVKGLD